MARALAVCCLLAVAALAADTAPQDRLDSVYVEQLLSDRSVLRTIVHCTLSEVDDRCFTVGDVLKSALPRLVETSCADCLRAASKCSAGDYARKYADDWKQRYVTF